MDARTPHPAKAVIVMHRLTVRELAGAMGVTALQLGRWLNRRPGDVIPSSRRTQLAQLLAISTGQPWALAELFHDDLPSRLEAVHVR